MNRVRLPNLKAEPYFSAIWHNDAGRFAVVLRDRRSFDLGPPQQALSSLSLNLGDLDFAQDILTMAENFGSSVCFLANKQVINGLDIFAGPVDERKVLESAEKMDWPIFG